MPLTLQATTWQPELSNLRASLLLRILASSQYPLAIDGYKNILKRAPENAGAFVGLGTVYYRQHEYTEAEPILAHAVRVTPQYSTAHYYYGLTLARLGRESESKTELATATALAPQQSQPPPR